LPKLLGTLKVLLYIITSKFPPLNKQLSNIILATLQYGTLFNFIPIVWTSQPDASKVNGPEIFSNFTRLLLSLYKLPST